MAKGEWATDDGLYIEPSAAAWFLTVVACVIVTPFVMTLGLMVCAVALSDGPPHPELIWCFPLLGLAPALYASYFAGKWIAVFLHAPIARVTIGATFGLLAGPVTWLVLAMSTFEGFH